MALSAPDRRTWVVGFGITLGNVAQSAVPWIVGGLHDSAGLSIQQSSLMTTAEMLTMGVVMLGVSAVVHQLPQKRVLACALVVCALAQIMTMHATAFWHLIAVRAASGVGFGVVYSLASAIGAGSATPERTFGTAGTIMLLLGTMIHPLLGYGLQHYGYRGVFGGIIIFTSILAIPLCLISFRGLELDKRQSPAATQEGNGMPDDSPINVIAAAGVMLTMALMASAVTGIFVFIEQIARAVGLQGTTLGEGMSVVSLIGAAGGLLANLASRHVSSTAPLLIGLPCMGVTILGMTLVSSPSQFWIVFTTLVVLFWFLYPFVFGLASVVDPKGRIASGTAGAKILFSAGGAALAGWMAASFGLISFGYAAVGICSVSALLALLVIFNLRFVKKSGEGSDHLSSLAHKLNGAPCKAKA